MILHIMKATPVPEPHVMSLCHLKCSQAGWWPRSPAHAGTRRSTVFGGQADWSSWHWNPLRFFDGRRRVTCAHYLAETVDTYQDHVSLVSHRHLPGAAVGRHLQLVPGAEQPV